MRGFIILHRIPARCARPIVHVFDECKQPLSFERQFQLGESRSLDAVGQARIIVVAVERDDRTAMRDCRLEHCPASLELLAVHEGEKRVGAVKRLERFGDVVCDCNLVSGADKRLRDAFEKRCVRTNYENRCHYEMRAPSASASTLTGETPSTSTVLPRDDCPETILTARLETPSAFARKSISSSFAAPSTGGACSRTFSAAP
jgi:hypothetical protein